MPTDPSLIKAARTLLGLSQAELAEKARIGARTLWKIERGDRSISVENYAAITTALEKAGIVFLPRSQDAGSGVRMSSELQQRLDSEIESERQQKIEKAKARKKKASATEA